MCCKLLFLYYLLLFLSSDLLTTQERNQPFGTCCNAKLFLLSEVYKARVIHSFIPIILCLFHLRGNRNSNILFWTVSGVLYEYMYIRECFVYTNLSLLTLNLSYIKRNCMQKVFEQK